MLAWLIVVAAGLPYTWLILQYSRGLKLVFRDDSKNSTPESNEQASLVVAVRNEEMNLANFLENLLQSENMSSLKEIILVNDHSEDATQEILKKHATRENKISTLNLKTGQHGKKQALIQGIKKATSNIILTTDADCLVGKSWVKSHLSGFENQKTMIQAGLIRMRAESFFDKIQEIEFSSLMASAAGSSGIQRPIMINGANLSFRKDVYLKIHDQLALHHPSGDDMFLLQAIKLHYPEGVQFNKELKSAVVTRPQDSLKAFIHQRLRWAAKSTLYTDLDILLSGAFVVVINTSLFGLLILAILKTLSWEYYLVLLFLKTVVDIILLNRYFKYTQHPKKWLLYIIPIQILYPVYAIGIAIFSQFVKINWKNRTYNAHNTSIN